MKPSMAGALLALMVMATADVAQDVDLQVAVFTSVHVFEVSSGAIEAAGATVLDGGGPDSIYNAFHE